MAQLALMFLLWNMATSSMGDQSLVNKLKEDISKAQKYYTAVSQLIMSEQFDTDEMVRSSGSSGIKKIRTVTQGTEPYSSTSHANVYTIAAIHDHPELKGVLGSGEMAVVMNGVEFRTRHNDFLLQKRAKSGRGVGLTEDVPLPQVPPRVRRYPSFAQQAAEMRQWFKAWRDQSPERRDYRKYFKPFLCYMEGAWTTPPQNSSIKEPFQSLTHLMDSATWENMGDRARFTDYSGTRHPTGNLAYEPTRMMQNAGSTKPFTAQWNYGIFCHPIKDGLALKSLTIVDDLRTRMSQGYLSMDEYYISRGARFKLDKRELLDKLMQQIPGRDGYGAKIGGGFPRGTAFYANTTTPLNDAYYHRWYTLAENGQDTRMLYHRSFSDANVFMARTTDKSVVEIPTTICVRHESCRKMQQRWTYAIPLEIVYATPLHQWNPFALKKRATKGSGNTPKWAYRGINDKHYYLTPENFFAKMPKHQFGDTPRPQKFIRDSKNRLRRVVGSGFYVVLPEIAGVGRIRTRFPIMPVHGEDSAVWKEINALKNIVLYPTIYQHMYYESTNYLCTT